jgi:hypothetical protein
MENVIFWIIVIGTGIWSFQWIINVIRSLGHKTMIIPIILLWIMIIYFYRNPNLSKYNMLWVSPSIIAGEMIISMMIARIIRKIKE